MYYELTPAYGRDYKNKTDVVTAWNAGNDFIGDYQLGFQLLNREDIPKPCTVLLRYRANRSVVSVKVLKAEA